MKVVWKDSPRASLTAERMVGKLVALKAVCLVVEMVLKRDEWMVAETVA